MGSAQELEELMRRMGLTRGEIQARTELLDWQPADASRLNEHAEPMAKAQAIFTDRLYEHLRRFPGPATLIGDDATPPATTH